MKRDIRAELENRILVLDGAMGTMLQRFKFTEEDFRGAEFKEHPSPLKGNNDLLSLTQLEAIYKVPIIPGLKPMAIERHLQLLPQIFKIDLPEPLIAEIETCKDNKQIRQLGIEWCVAQSRELMEAGVPLIHYYSMGKSSNIMEIGKELF